MQNIFIVPAMQHGCRAKPLLLRLGIEENILRQLLGLRSHGNVV